MQMTFKHPFWIPSPPLKLQLLLQVGFSRPSVFSLTLQIPSSNALLVESQSSPLHLAPSPEPGQEDSRSLAIGCFKAESALFEAAQETQRCLVTYHFDAWLWIRCSSLRLEASVRGLQWSLIRLGIAK